MDLGTLGFRFEPAVYILWLGPYYLIVIYVCGISFCVLPYYMVVIYVFGISFCVLPLGFFGWILFLLHLFPEGKLNIEKLVS